MKKLSLITLLFLTTFFASAQEYQIVFDKYWSPYSGASITTSTYNFYKFIDDRYLPNGEGKTDMSWGFARIGKLSLDFILGSFLSTAQHEVFGHGYRAREFSFSDVGYRIGIGTGATYFLLSDYERLNLYQQNAMNAAGMEANVILSEQIRNPWFSKKTIDYRDGLLYTLNQLEQFQYAYVTHDTELTSGDDIVNYSRGVNQYYGNNNLSIGKIRTAVLWDLFDPALYYSLYSIGEFLVNGTPTATLGMIPIQGYQYLPAGRTILAPWGLEFALQNFIITPEKSLLQVNLHYGNNSNLSSWGIDVNFKPIYKRDRWIIGNQLSIWVQPSMSYANAALTHKKFGFAEFINFEYKTNNTFSFIGDLGYKTAGFMQGFILSNNFIVRIGFKW